jgi:tetratricopeptide (TPR) repeat protein
LIRSSPKRKPRSESAALNSDFGWDEAEKYLLRAIEISPNSVLAHSWYQILLFEGGRFEEGRRELNRVLELNPTRS